MKLICISGAISCEVRDTKLFPTRRDGVLRHFWAGEMTTSDPGQDPRGAPDPAPLWTVLDMTPEGRGGDWYPSLSYA